ncbi:MAG: SET domain-containing protein [Chloroherpetonaceae bacterium]
MFQSLPDSALYNPDYIVVLDSPIQGKGIFTTKPCEMGEALMIIAGETINADECLRREAEEANVYIFYNNDDTYIDTAMTAKIRYINHSCEPNAEVKERDHQSLYLVALRPIQAGEEITIDYDYEEIYDVCFSQNPTCRKDQCAARRRMLDLQSLSE